MKRQQKKPGYNKRLLGLRHAPSKAGGAVAAAGGPPQKLPSYKNRMRSIQRLLNKVSALGSTHMLVGVLCDAVLAQLCEASAQTRPLVYLQENRPREQQ